MSPKESVFSEEAVLKEIKDQIENNDPPETKQTYNRLMKEIKNHDEVMEYLGVVMRSEILEILISKKPFNRKRYVERLNRLPDISWAE